jgi:hypothetical protein
VVGDGDGDGLVMIEGFRSFFHSYPIIRNRQGVSSLTCSGNSPATSLNLTGDSNEGYFHCLIRLDHTS